MFGEVFGTLVLGTNVVLGMGGIRGVWGGVWNPCVRYIQRKEVFFSW